MEQKMPTRPGAHRRARRRPKVENLYKILGVRANATPETIRKSYIESVKRFPPETHPEEFQQVRRAYETLRDPDRRSEYDLMRKYGGQIEAIMEEAFELMEAERWEKAAGLLRKALELAPHDLRVRLALGQALLELGDDQAFREQFQAAYEQAPPDRKIRVLAIQAKILLDEERPEEALVILEDARRLHPEQSHLLQWLCLEVYRELDREDELWDLVQSMLPAPEEQTPEQIDVFVIYINTLIDLEKWSAWSSVQARVRKFLKSIDDEDDRLMAVAALKNEHDEHFEAGFFRAAEIFIDLAYYIDSKNPLLQRQRRETQEMARVEKEIDRMSRDQNQFPLVHIYAFEWFYEGYLPPELLHFLRDQAPPDLWDELQEMDEELAAGIVHLRKRYPLTYRRFQERWDEMFKERAGHLNREARRRLR